ncbi:hypothetical protein BCT61_01100 [Vibrio breoganii]|uniref:hypothetical protein n=1 Tax=Vibrio breoganii TaxID=553239 RepID=UPI000C84FB8E|nr:hypothetical protein [Vibrio breoganii]PMM08455.1 hypothetical protein BCT61_01100 [Vibrio breoganii]
MSALGSLYGLLIVKDRGYDWQWLGFPLLDSGVQIARTKDTHQLLLRKLYPLHSMEVSAYTTMDNNMVLQLTIFTSCDNDVEAQLAVNHDIERTITLTCTDSNELRYLSTEHSLEQANIKLNGRSTKIDFTPWNIAELKKDQFKQLHPAYFERLGESPEFQWSRD